MKEIEQIDLQEVLSLQHTGCVDGQLQNTRSGARIFTMGMQSYKKKIVIQH